MSAPIAEKEPGPAPEVATPVAEKKKREYKDFGHETEAATRMFHFPLFCVGSRFSRDSFYRRKGRHGSGVFSFYSYFLNICLRRTADRTQGRGPLR
jgi:hypothetical protein